MKIVGINITTTGHLEVLQVDEVTGKKHRFVLLKGDWTAYDQFKAEVDPLLSAQEKTIAELWTDE